MIVPEIQTPDIIADDKVNMDEIYASIEEIINADSSMSDEEKAAALDELKTQLSAYVQDLSLALEEISAQEAALTATVDSLSGMEAQLSEAQANVDTLTAAVEESNAAVAALETELAGLTAQSEADSAQIAALEAQIAEAKAEAAALTEQLAAANARMAELQAYMLNRELTDGQAHVASTQGNVITVAADGVSATWNYSNDITSGNNVVISITIDEVEIYRSASLQPGEALEAFQLASALEAGSHNAVVATTVWTDGVATSTTRVPVTVQVG